MKLLERGQAIRGSAGSQFRQPTAAKRADPLCRARGSVISLLRLLQGRRAVAGRCRDEARANPAQGHGWRVAGALSKGYRFVGPTLGFAEVSPLQRITAEGVVGKRLEIRI